MRRQATEGALFLATAFALGLIGMGALGVGTARQAAAQAIPKSLEEGGTHVDLRNRKNMWTVGVAGGLMSGTNMTFADEMAQVLDDGDNLRVIPMVTYGAASNLDDLLYLHGVDVAVTQSDVFEYFKTQRKIANLEGRVNYILRLPIWNCTPSPARTSSRSRICAARRSISVGWAARRAATGRSCSSASG